MAKTCKLEVNLHWIHHWLNLWKLKIIPKKMTKIHSIVATCVLLGSCSASFVVLATIILANSDFVGLASTESVSCDFSHYSTSVCSLRGDVRVRGSSLAVTLMSSNQSTHSNALGKIRPYTRKWEKMMKTIGEVNMVSLPRSKFSSQMACDVRHSVPAVIFSTGGYTGSVFHDFNDGLVPLFITAQRFKGEVMFMVLQFKQWWPGKYAPILKQLTHYPVVDFDREQLVHCFPEVIVGLNIHGDLLIEEGLAEGTSMRNFQNLLGIALSPGQVVLPKTTPKLVLVDRETTRVIVNKNETVELAQKLGFEVHTFAPNFHSRLSEIYSLLHSADVLIGVHGAALTHFLFMRPSSTLIQIIPFGLDEPAETCFGKPAQKAGLNYVGYQILPSESTLSDDFGLNHTVIVNPNEVIAKGWTERKRIYLDGQNIRLHLPRLEQILKNVLARLRSDQ